MLDIMGLDILELIHERRENEKEEKRRMDCRRREVVNSRLK